MLCRSLLLVTWSTLSLLTLQAGQPPKEGEPVQWPGVKHGGSVLLPNGWSLKPSGRQTALGDFPVNIALHPSGKFLAILHAGYGDHEIIIIDAKSSKKLNRVIIDQTFYGLTFSPDGKRLFASGGEFEVVHVYDFNEGLLSKHHKIEIAKITDKFMPSGMAVNQAGDRLYVAGLLGDQLATISLDKNNDKQMLSLGEASFPYGVALSPDQKTLFVSKWGKAEVAIVDVATNKVMDTLKTSDHPTEMAITPDGSRLFVACSNSTQVTVHDLKTKKPLETLSAALYPSPKVGNTPNSLAMTPDGQLLFVANADANNIAVFNVAKVGETKPLGFIPVGWYPTSVRYNPGDKKVYVANGKGNQSFANPQGPMPLQGLNSRSPTTQYIGSLMRGTLSTFDLPTPAKMGDYTRSAFACSPFKGEEINQPVENNPIPAKVGDKSPIKYCIYIIKENRTYDQIFGDMAPRKGNGAPYICLFPENVTPNHHKLADTYGLFDNFYVESEVSADGHEWTTAAYATDYVEKLWPLNYRGSPQKKIGYPAEGENIHIAPSAGGYIWDRCKEAGVSYRSYGEFIDNGLTDKMPCTTRIKNLEGHFDPWYRSFDMDYPDQKRADRFLAELQRMEKEGDMPRLQIMRLSSDHTSGTRVGKPSPIAQVADNDLALGRVVEAVSKSKFWKETAIFVVEDDAQNGSDHVDAHRSVGMAISPYTKRNQVDSTLYSTSSMLRSMELILGLKPMSQFDAAARPMYNAFTMKADFTPYTHLPANIDLHEKNRPDAFGAVLSEKMNFAKEDQADDLLFNEIIWKSVKGKNSPMPPPVRAAFVIPKD